MSTHALFAAPVQGRSPRAPRLRARLYGWRLDGDLAAGADPASSPDLAARAAWLCRTRHRAQLAAGLERIVREANRPGRSLTASRPTHRPTIHAARPELLAVATVLRGPHDLHARGLALVRRLLVDDVSPLYTGGVDLLLPALAEIRGSLACEVRYKAVDDAEDHR